jgi:hypothetical protein
MSTLNKFAIAALLTLVAAPAFAGDQDTAAIAVSSGRYLPDVQAQHAFTGAYASAVRPGQVRDAARGTLLTGDDFQLGGR